MADDAATPPILYAGQHNQPSLFMHEFKFLVPTAHDNVRSAQKGAKYLNDMSLEQMCQILEKRANYSVMTRAFLSTLFHTFYGSLTPSELGLLEQIVVKNFKEFYLLFSYTMDSVAKYDQSAFKLKTPIKKVEIEHNIVRNHHEVSLQTSGVDIQLHFLAPTRKDPLVETCPPP